MRAIETLTTRDSGKFSAVCRELLGRGQGLPQVAEARSGHHPDRAQPDRRGQAVQVHCGGCGPGWGGGSSQDDHPFW